ncbi:MAG: glycerol kinase GlpK [Spirochaetales bacterium]|nr:glycerol kinase GlpK [Spirochaetales bacterium]
MATFYILGIDQSTQGTKAVLFDKNGKMIGRSDISHRQIISKESWVSHDPEEIYHNIIAATRKVVEETGIDKKQINCIGISNQRETTVCWNKKTGKPLDNAIVWHCNRAKAICNRIGEDSSITEDIYERTGLKLSSYYPAGKILWMIENLPEIKKLISENSIAFGTVDSWLIYKLTCGDSFKTDYSNASRTQLFNIKELQWDQKICDAFNVPIEALPEVCDSDSIFGYTDLDGFLGQKIPINGVLGDSHGALFGHNCLSEGDIKATYGTGASVMLNTGDEPFFSKYGLSTSLAWKVKGKVSYVLEGNINYTGAVISWLKDQLGLIKSASEAEALARAADPHDHTYIVPAFSGLGAPWWRDDTNAIITGMSRNTGKNEIVKAGSESAAYQINDVITAMRKDSGISINQMCVDGGPTRNNYLMQFQSDITNISIKIPTVEEFSVIGASYLAGISAGLYDERNVYKNISYSLYKSEMNEIDRKLKTDGWNEAIEMLIGTSKRSNESAE